MSKQKVSSDGEPCYDNFVLSKQGTKIYQYFDLDQPDAEANGFVQEPDLCDVDCWQGRQHQRRCRVSQDGKHSPNDGVERTDLNHPGLTSTTQV